MSTDPLMRTFTRASLEKMTDAETLQMLGIFCGAGLLLSLLVIGGIYGVDATTRTSVMACAFITMLDAFADPAEQVEFPFDASESCRAAGLRPGRWQATV